MTGGRAMTDEPHPINGAAPTQTRTVLTSASAADDGGLIAVADVAKAAALAGVGDRCRLFGGIAVMLHVLRLGLDLPLRQTGDADHGVQPFVLQDGGLIKELKKLGYDNPHFSNTWERQVDERRTATTDLLIPSYTSRARDSKEVGGIVTTEVPGLAQAFLRPPVEIAARFRLSDGSRLDADIALADAVGMLVLKCGARLVRDEERDASDLWRCLEIAFAEKVSPSDLPTDPIVGNLADALHEELGRAGRSIPAIVRDLTPETAGKLVTRIQALLLQVTGR